MTWASSMATMEKAPFRWGSTSSRARSRWRPSPASWSLRSMARASISATRSLSEVTAPEPGSMPRSVGELGGVDQVAVVAERDLVAGGLAGDGLGVLPGAGAGGAVAGVPDGEVPGQSVELAVVEDRRDQAVVLQGDQLGAVGHGHAGSLLAAVLQGEQPEVGEVGDRLPRRVDAEDPAGLLQLVAIEGRNVGGRVLVHGVRRHPSTSPGGVVRQATR